MSFQNRIYTTYAISAEDVVMTASTGVCAYHKSVHTGERSKGLEKGNISCCACAYLMLVQT